MLSVLPNLHFKGRKFSRALMKVNTGTAACQDTKVMGKASRGPSEKISPLEAPLGHPHHGGRQPPARNSLWEAREAAGSAAVCDTLQSALP